MWACGLQAVYTGNTSRNHNRVFAVNQQTFEKTLKKEQNLSDPIATEFRFIGNKGKSFC